jgi:lipoyl-dependent peroxiredoxin subunit D
MEALEALRQKLPEEAKDLKINLQSVMKGGSLSDDQRWGVAVACAIASRNPELREATYADAKAVVSEAVISDAKAAAALMGMNNMFYRFRHMMKKESYGRLPARLRMQRMAKPATNKLDFELFSLGVSVINGCELCITSHEKAVVDGGLTETHVHDTARIAAIYHAVAVALEM